MDGQSRRKFSISISASFLPAANEVLGKVIFLEVVISHSVQRGCAWRRGGGVTKGHACEGWGCAWQGGACIAGDMHGKGHVWQRGHVCRRDSHSSGRYASYWNTFLLSLYLSTARNYVIAVNSLIFNSHMCFQSELSDLVQNTSISCPSLNIFKKSKCSLDPFVITTFL